MKNYFFLILVLTAFLSSCGSKTVKKDEKAIQDSVVKDAFVEFVIMPEDGSNKNQVSDSLSFETNKAFIGSCDAAFSVVYQKLSLKTDKDYLEKLNYLYESSSQEDLQNRRSSSAGFSVPDFGAFNWGSNKSKVKSIFKKYKTKIDYSLSYNEKIELNETYTRSEDVENSLNAWTECIKITNDIPYLELLGQSDSTVTVFFELKTNPFRNNGDKVKVRDISFSENLVLINDRIEGKKIEYGERYTLTFKRKDPYKAFVIVDLDEGYNIIPINIPAIEKDPVTVTRIINMTYECNIEINLPKNWLKVTTLEGELIGTQKFPNQKSPYKINFVVKTKLKNPESVIFSCYYTSTKGLAEFKFKRTILENDGTLSLDCYLATSQKYMTGKLTILYGITQEVCVANCPE